MLKGVLISAKAVQVTLGPKGRNVINDQILEILKITKHGSLIRMLGSCKKVIISQDDTIIIEGTGEKHALQERIEANIESIANTPSSYDKNKHKEGLEKLT